MASERWSIRRSPAAARQPSSNSGWCSKARSGGTAEPDGLELDMPAPASLSVTRFGPRFGDDGRASFFYQLTGDTCYACGDDAWDSYTRSLELPRDELPSALAAETLPRGAIAWLARTHPEEQIRGFGWARPEDRGAFEALPVR
jgi:hypothetical protein